MTESIDKPEDATDLDKKIKELGIKNWKELAAMSVKCPGPTEAFHIDPEPSWPGFMFTFPNQWSVSVQWGSGHYCDQGRTTAEVAIWDAEGDWYYHNDHNNILMLADEGATVVNEDVDALRLLKIMNIMAEQPNLKGADSGGT